VTAWVTIEVLGKVKESFPATAVAVVVLVLVVVALLVARQYLGMRGRQDG
jgi:hypothetical protein